MSIKSPLGRQLGTQFDSVFDVVKSNPLYDKGGGKIPSLDLNFAKSKSLRDSRSTKKLITFSRASSGTYVDSDGFIKISPVNLIKYSQKYDQQWTTDSTGTITINNTEAPDGTTTANRFVESNGNTSHAIRQTLTTSGTYTVSTYFKELSGSAKRYGVIRIHGVGATAPIAFFDLGNGTVTSTGGTNIISTNIVNVGNGWFRCSMTANEPILSGDGIQLGVTDSSNSFGSYSGDGTSGILIWGAQLEEGTTATDYIPTGSTISGAPRFDHDFDTRESLGLLVEASRTNTVINSNTVPGSSLGTPILNSTETVVSPRGISETVRRLGRDVPAGGAQIWRVGSTSGGNNNTTYTISFYAKTVNGGTTSINIDINDTAPTTGQASEITGEWTRIVKTGGVRPNGFRFFDMNMVTATEEFYVWGAQIEVGDFATSYIPTSDSAVTRSSDIAKIEGSNLTSWYSETESELTLFCDCTVIGGDGIAYMLSDGSNERFALHPDSAFGSDYYIRSGGSFMVLLSNIPGLPKRFTTALGYKPGSTVEVLDGVLGGEFNTTTVTPTGIDRLMIGNSNGFYVLTGYISRLAYYPTRLPNDKLISITI